MYHWASHDVPQLGVATCTQHYCWGTQQTVKWRNCLSAIILPEEDSSGNFPEKLFSELFRKNLLPEEQFVSSGSTHRQLPEERHPECSRKKLLPEVSFFFNAYVMTILPLCKFL